MKAGWWDPFLIALRDLAEAICITASNIYWSPQARFLIPCPNLKLQSQKKIRLRPQIPHTPTPSSKAHLFLTTRGKSKENLFIPGATQENLRTLPLAHKIFVPWIPIRNKKDEILDSPCVPHPWIKPGTQKIKFQPALNKTLSFKPPSPNHQQLKLFKPK